MAIEHDQIGTLGSFGAWIHSVPDSARRACMTAYEPAAQNGFRSNSAIPPKLENGNLQIRHSQAKPLV